jgi:hypothetical protein
MHRVLELILLNRHHELLTEQQQRDAEVLQRTLDRYGLTPVDGLCEQFVAYPSYRVTGRFDAVMERPDGSVILVDLKSGARAIEYPQSVSVQLALYARAGHVSAAIEGVGNTVQVTEWRTMPGRLDRKYGYVLLVEPDATVGSLHRVDIEHGWVAAQLALELVNWRKRKDDLVAPVDPWREGTDDVTPFVRMAIDQTHTLDELRDIWRTYAASGDLTPGVKALLESRVAALKVGA